MLIEREKKLFRDVKMLVEFLEDEVITVEQYYENKSKVLDNYLKKITEEKEDKGGKDDDRTLSRIIEGVY